MNRPAPKPSSHSEPFWDACTRGALVAQRCASCGVCRLPPSAACRSCWSAASRWETMSGRGRVHSFVVYRRGYDEALPPPYVVAVIELEEGPRIVSNVVGCDLDAVTCDMPVTVEFLEVAGGAAIPQFRPA